MRSPDIFRDLGKEPTGSQIKNSVKPQHNTIDFLSEEMFFFIKPAHGILEPARVAGHIVYHSDIYTKGAKRLSCYFNLTLLVQFHEKYFQVRSHPYKKSRQFKKKSYTLTILSTCIPFGCLYVLSVQLLATDLQIPKRRWMTLGHHI